MSTQTPNTDGSDEDIWHAPAILVGAMFPERSGWYRNLEWEQQHAEMYGEVLPFETWYQQSRCTACGIMNIISVPMGRLTAPEVFIPDVFGQGKWYTRAIEHADECRKRGTWLAMIVSTFGLARWFAAYKGAHNGDEQ